MKLPKFRAWDKERERMVYFEPLQAVWFYEDGYRIQGNETDASANGRDFIAHDDFLDKQPDVELMQFTGLKDKNGVEIYGGDIVNVNPPTQLPRLETVKFYTTAGFASLHPFTDSGHHWSSYNCEVVGNIHQQSTE